MGASAQLAAIQDRTVEFVETMFRLIVHGKCVHFFISLRSCTWWDDHN